MKIFFFGLVNDDLLKSKQCYDITLYTIVTAIEIQMMNIIDRHFPKKSEAILVCTPK